MTEPALPGATGHLVAAMLVGSGVGFLVRFAYLAILSWTAVAALQLVLIAGAVGAFGWLGYRLTGRRYWWYGAAVIGGLFAGAVLLFAFV